MTGELVGASWNMFERLGVPMRGTQPQTHPPNSLELDRRSDTCAYWTCVIFVETLIFGNFGIEFAAAGKHHI